MIEYAWPWIMVLLGGASVGIGFFLVNQPKAAIAIQQRFYEAINWRMEPVSWPKEVRNTRLMGWSLILMGLAILVIMCVMY